MTATDALTTAQASAVAARNSLAALWAEVDAGTSVDPAQIASTEDQLAVLDRQIQGLQLQAQREQHAAAVTAWQPVEQQAAADYASNAGALWGKITAAQQALGDALAASWTLTQQVDAFRADNRRPPIEQADGTWIRSDGDTANGVRLRRADPAAVLAEVLRSLPAPFGGPNSSLVARLGQPPQLPPRP